MFKKLFKKENSIEETKIEEEVVNEETTDEKEPTEFVDDETDKAEEPEKEDIKSEPEVIDSIDGINKIGCMVVSDFNYHGKYILKPFIEEENLFLPIIINDSIRVSVGYQMIPTELIAKCVNRIGDDEENETSDEGGSSQDRLE